MILISKNQVFGGKNGRAIILTDPAMSSQKHPVLIIDKKPISPQETALAELDVIKANKRELALLKREAILNRHILIRQQDNITRFAHRCTYHL
jgi:hypothetical protein